MRPHARRTSGGLLPALAAGLPLACGSAETGGPAADAAVPGSLVLQPAVVTERVVHDTDDPAIWVDPPREGAGGDPHAHPLLKSVRVAARESDGSEVTSARLGPRFPEGLFVAMSEGGVFHYYAWPELAAPDLAVAPGGERPQRPSLRPRPSTGDRRGASR